MHKSQIVKKQKSTAGEHKDQLVYLTIKSRTKFDSESKDIKCVLLVKTAKKIIYQSHTITIKIENNHIVSVCDKASKQVHIAEAFWFDAVYGHNKIIQIPLW